MAPKTKTKKSETLTLTFDKVSDTKNMVRFAERGQDERPINLYLRKDQVPEGTDSLTVEISFE